MNAMPRSFLLLFFCLTLMLTGIFGTVVGFLGGTDLALAYA